MKQLTTCLWFDSEAEEAAKFYTSIFPNSKINGEEVYQGKEVEEVSGKEEGSVITVSFELDGNKFLGLNGGPTFKFTEAISFMIDCKDQEEVDYYWNKLIEGGGEESQCGWLKDKFGVSWQVIPERFAELMGDEDGEKVQRVVAAMLKMKKLIVADLEKAAE